MVDLRQKYLRDLAQFNLGQKIAIENYFEIILKHRKKYPDIPPNTRMLQYKIEGKELFVKYMLPSVSIIPKVKMYKYIKSKDSIEEIYYSETVRKKMYNEIVAQIVIRTLYELFLNDQCDYLKKIIFETYGYDLDMAIGKWLDRKIVNLIIEKETFLALDLKQISPVLCLKYLANELYPI